MGFGNTLKVLLSGAKGIVQSQPVSKENILKVATIAVGGLFVICLTWSLAPRPLLAFSIELGFVLAYLFYLYSTAQPGAGASSS